MFLDALAAGDRDRMQKAMGIMAVITTDRQSRIIRR